MLTLHVEANSYDELARQCWAALGLQQKDGKLTAAETPTKVTPNGAGETGKKPVGRPKKEEAPEKVAPPPSDKPLTLEQVRNGLQAYAETFEGGKTGQVGIMKAREVLAKFQSVKGTPCKQIAEIQDQDYAAVLALCAA